VGFGLHCLSNAYRKAFIFRQVIPLLINDYQNKLCLNFHFESHEYDIFQKIVRLNYSFPEYFDEKAKDLIQKLVVTEPAQRLGAYEESQSGYAQLKVHPYFSNIDWTNLSEQTPPPISQA
jgi:serine/threonine protein kinase